MWQQASLCKCTDGIWQICLQGLPLLSVELWAKLARAAAGVQVWNVALECSREAAKVGRAAPAVY